MAQHDGRQGYYPEDFLSMNERYQHFDAAKAGNVWIDRKRVNEYGG